MTIILRAISPILELDVLNDFCHDALVEQKAVVFESQLRRLTLKIQRETAQLGQRRTLFGFRQERTRVLSRLIIHNVVDVHMAMKDIEDMISSVKYAESDGILTLHFVKRSEVSARLIQLEVELIDEEIVNANCTQGKGKN